VLELGIAVGVLGTLPGLHIGLQAVAQPAQQLRDRGEVDLVAQLAQPVGELAHALDRPAQRPLGIAARLVVDEPLEI
jgi:hypothetical protein